MSTVILTADEIHAAHADAEAEAVAAEAALAEAEKAAAGAREVITVMEEQVRQGGPAFGIEEFHAASVAVRHAELTAEGARNRAVEARGRVPDVRAELAIADAKAYLDSPELAEMQEIIDELRGKMRRVTALAHSHHDKAHALAKRLQDAGIPWAQANPGPPLGYAEEGVFWHGWYIPPCQMHPNGKAGRVDSYTIDGVTVDPDSGFRFVDAVYEGLHAQVLRSAKAAE